MLETSISFKAKGYRVATMTVLSRAKEFGFEFWFLGFDFEVLRAKKKPHRFLGRA